MSESAPVKRARLAPVPGCGPVQLLCLDGIDLKQVTWNTLEGWLFWMISSVQCAPGSITSHHQSLFNEALTRPECLSCLDVNRVLLTDNRDSRISDSNDTVLMHLFRFTSYLNGYSVKYPISKEACDSLCELIGNPTFCEHVDRTNLVGQTALTLICNTPAFVLTNSETHSIDRIFYALVTAGANVNHIDRRFCTSPFSIIGKIHSSHGRSKKEDDGSLQLARITRLLDATATFSTDVTFEFFLITLCGNLDLNDPLQILFDRVYMLNPAIISAASQDVKQRMECCNDEIMSLNQEIYDIDVVQSYGEDSDSNYDDECQDRLAELETAQERNSALQNKLDELLKHWEASVPDALRTNIDQHLVPDLCNIVVRYVCG